MTQFWLPGDSDFALAMREPNLLVPGKLPIGNIVPKYKTHFACLGGSYGYYAWGVNQIGTKSGTAKITGDGIIFASADSGRLTFSSFTTPSSSPWSLCFDAEYDGSGTSRTFLLGNSGATAGLFLDNRTISLRLADGYVELENFFSSTYGRKRAVITHDGSGNFRVYAIDTDGSYITASTSSAVVGGFANILSFGGGYLSSFSLNGLSRYFSLISECLTEGKAIQVLANPIANLFRPANDAPFLVSVPAGGVVPTLSSPGVINVLSDRATPQVTLTF